MSFSKLGLSDPILKAVSELGYKTPTEIQKQAIPIILSGKDLMAAAQTGTGKTASFVLPLLEKIKDYDELRGRSVRLCRPGCCGCLSRRSLPWSWRVFDDGAGRIRGSESAHPCKHVRGDGPARQHHRDDHSGHGGHSADRTWTRERGVEHEASPGNRRCAGNRQRNPNRVSRHLSRHIDA